MDEFSYLKIGDKVPDFNWTDMSGAKCSSENLYGKISLIILFTANCRHCRNNMIHLEDTLFSKNPGHINILAICRDCDPGVSEPYLETMNLSINVIADPDREIFSKFAEMAVPRNYLFDSQGNLIQAIRGYRPQEVDKMIEMLLANKEG